MTYMSNGSRRQTKYLGRVTFPSKKIRATDPCYTKDVWCATTVPVEHEEWEAWVVIEDHREWGNRVSKLILTRPGVLPMTRLGERLDWQCEFQGKPSAPVCGVDSGQLGFFDAESWPGRDRDEAWYSEVCDITIEEINRAGLCRFGVVTSSGFGDGAYPLYVHRCEGKIVEIAAVFIEEES